MSIGYLGPVGRDESLPLTVLTLNGSGTPTNATGTVTARIFDSGLQQVASHDVNAVGGETGLYNHALDVSGETYQSGEKYLVLWEYTVSGTDKAQLAIFDVY